MKLSATASAKTKPEQTAWTSKATPRVMPSLACTCVAVAGKVSSGVVVPTTIRSTSGRRDTGCRERAVGGANREIGGQLAVGGDVTLTNAGARDDPLVRGLDLLGQVGVGDDPLRKIRTAAEDL